MAVGLKILDKYLLNSVGAQTKFCWNKRTLYRLLTNYITSHLNTSFVSPPAINSSKCRLPFVFENLLLFSAGLNCWSLVLKSNAVSLSDEKTNNTISYYMLVVFLVILCWGSLLNDQYQLDSRRRKSLCARRQSKVLQIWFTWWIILQIVVY